jgi:hypothetical protein
MANYNWQRGNITNLPFGLTYHTATPSLWAKHYDSTWSKDSRIIAITTLKNYAITHKQNPHYTTEAIYLIPCRPPHQTQRIPVAEPGLFPIATVDTDLPSSRALRIPYLSNDSSPSMTYGDFLHITRETRHAMIVKMVPV